MSNSQYLHISHVCGPVQYKQFKQSVCAVEWQDNGVSAAEK